MSKLTKISGVVLATERHHNSCETAAVSCFCCSTTAFVPRLCNERMHVRVPLLQRLLLPSVCDSLDVDDVVAFDGHPQRLPLTVEPVVADRLPTQ